jgi:apolipoprotein D and lipocalin family protein
MAFNDLPTVTNIDLPRYTGIWFEIARLPNRFEKGLKCITASYGIKGNGKIEVVNAGNLINNPKKVKQSTGKAWVPDNKFPGRLKVQFFWPFSGDYYIIELDPDYRYALIGEPGRKYLWILSRTRELDEPVYQHLLDKATSLGFDTSLMIRDAHDCSGHFH